MSKLLKFGLPLLVVGGLLAFKLAQPKGPLDIHSAPTEVTINAGSLYEAFETEETSANGKYVGKVIEVSGALSSISQDDSGRYIISLSADSPLGQITCNLAPKEPNPTTTVAVGQSIIIKGVCTGYLFDVVLDNATLLAK